ncbi:MAG: peptide deformylase [Patescibacteria group bacterium]
MKTKVKNLFVSKDSLVLREVASAVKVEEISSKKITAIIKDMKKALHGEEDGVAIAAPQIGAGLRIFVVNAAVLAIAKKKSAGKETLEDLVFINPEIVKVSRKKKKMEEGCLSLRYLYGQVLRHEKITINAYDERGARLVYGASGLLAQIFQHEIDHLNGILFTDKAENVRDLPPDHHESQKS